MLYIHMYSRTSTTHVTCTVHTHVWYKHHTVTCTVHTHVCRSTVLYVHMYSTSTTHVTCTVCTYVQYKHMYCTYICTVHCTINQGSPVAVPDRGVAVNFTASCAMPDSSNITVTLSIPSLTIKGESPTKFTWMLSSASGWIVTLLQFWPSLMVTPSSADASGTTMQGLKYSEHSSISSSMMRTCTVTVVDSGGNRTGVLSCEM